MKKIIIILTMCLCVAPSIVWAAGVKTSQKKETAAEQPTPKEKAKAADPKQEPYYSDPSNLLFSSQLNKTVKVEHLCKKKKDIKAETETEYDRDCAYISKDFGICDTHAYNAGLNHNPKNTDEKEKMNSIISAKITVLSQQMYKQYEYLNATLTRLEKQLSKAVLTAELEMASGKSDSDSSGYSSSSSKETPLAGAENCMYAGAGLKAYECLNRNLMLIQSNIETNRAQAKKQLEQTYNVAKQYGINACWSYEDSTKFTCQKVDKNSQQTEDPKEIDPCNKDKLKTKTDIKSCADILTIAVSRAINAENKDLMKYSNPNYRY